MDSNNSSHNHEATYRDADTVQHRHIDEEVPHLRVGEGGRQHCPVPAMHRVVERGREVLNHEAHFSGTVDEVPGREHADVASDDEVNDQVGPKAAHDRQVGLARKQTT